MTSISTSRLALAALALLAEALHLGWEAQHGGIVSHHLLQNADLPALSNAWGLLLLPALAAWAAGRLPRRPATTRDWLPVALGFVLPLVCGAALSLAFSLKLQAVTEAIFFGLLLLAVLLPAHRPESLLGFVLGMSWTFGAVLPALAGGVIAGLSWAVRGLARRAWQTARPA
jgi:drug/metabolite transporter (DMT)-like permease